MNEPNLPHDASSQSRLEQRLHSMKPRQPLLDIDAIAKIADAKAQANQIRIALAQQSNSWYSTKVLAGTIAASWAFGVAVGASAVFYALSTDQPTDVNSRVAVTDAVGPAHEVAASTPTTPSTVESNSAEGSVPGQLDLVRWDLGLGTEPLQVGMSLRSRNRLVRTGALASTNAVARNSERSSIDLQKAIGPILDASTQLPSAPITQSELLKSLLNDANRDIH